MTMVSELVVISVVVRFSARPAPLKLFALIRTKNHAVARRILPIKETVVLPALSYLDTVTVVHE